MNKKRGIYQKHVYFIYVNNGEVKKFIKIAGDIYDTRTDLPHTVAHGE